MYVKEGSNTEVYIAFAFFLAKPSFFLWWFCGRERGIQSS